MPSVPDEKIEQLFHAARALPASERTAYLAVHCASDNDARREVERLLRGHDAAGDFLATPAVNALPGKLSGRRLAHYQLLSLLGKGGMGEVYLAEDTRLHRKVALKLLPANFTGDADRVRRFEREAIAASALNHPNILTIHEIGHEQNTHYIATEFIAGSTLRQRLTEARLPLRTALDIAVQTASALVAAHEAGIVHRDIKPENVMLRSDGLVKVLDFGLAKLTETRSAERGARNEEAETLLQNEPKTPHDVPDTPQLTDPGTVMGTASYMSPEQARGREVDARSDIFSLGVMLYEMIAGRTPFAGVNPIDVLGAILNQEPAPLQQHVANPPSELQRIVSKALRKDRDERYQHSKDLWLDLNDLRRELEFEEKLKARQMPVTETSEQDRPKATAEAVDTPPMEGASTQPTISSAQYLIGEIKRHKTGAMVGLTVLLACIALLAYGLYRFAVPKQSVARFQNVKLTRLTSVGNVKGQSVSISPDGKFIAYAQKEAGQNSLWTKAIATGSAVQIVPPTQNDLYNTTFSPDGDYVYYQRQEGQPTLYQIPVLGGTPKKVLTEIYSQLTFSPDGKQFAFLRPGPDKTKSQLIVVNTDGSGERILAERQLSEQFRSPSWSPDGRIIAVAALSREGESLKPLLLSVAVESGKVEPLVEPKHSLRTFNNVRWLKDGKELALIANEPGNSNYQIWHVSYPDGEVRRITNDLANYPSLSLTADNSALVADQSESYSNLWITPLSDSSRAQNITRDNNREGFNGVAWAPDEWIVYTSYASGKLDIWRMNAEGSNVRQLTNDAAYDYKPIVSSDGRYVVYVSLRSGKANLWRIDLNGNNPKQLTAGDIDQGFDLSPDGRWAVFFDRDPEVRKLYKVSLEGGTPQLVYDGLVSRPAVSPDGKLIACLSPAPQSSQPKVVILPFEGGAPIKTLECNLATSNLASLRWTPDGRALLYVDARQDAANLWRLPLNGNPPQQVTNFNDAKPERIWTFDLSRDGKQLVIARGGTNADVVLISEVK